MSDAWVIDQAASGNITRQGLCWSRDPSQPDYLALTTGPCLPFTVIAVAASNPYPAGVKVIQQFEAGSVSQILQDYRNQSTAARNDFFVADLGFSGMRRFQPLGNNYWSNEDRLYYVNLSNNTLPSLIRLREEQDEIAKSKNSYTVDNIENVFVENNAEDFERNQNQESTTIIDRTVYRTIESIGDRPPLFHQPQPQPIPPRRMFTTFEPGAIGFPFIPNPDIESSAFGFIQVIFILISLHKYLSYEYVSYKYVSYKYLSYKYPSYKYPSYKYPSYKYLSNTYPTHTYQIPITHIPVTQMHVDR
eukprot:TRINITY_DN11609_c0_g2_i14.p1 TRINITY_DN11609_c0_g2~~TRINITY_DN11609_c0_g2_i14.p1  ORF type:complete len:304 (-),score=7.69 TRINITY_DN11609_c0_g2_i14:61-972(-)